MSINRLNERLVSLPLGSFLLRVFENERFPCDESCVEHESASLISTCIECEAFIRSCTDTGTFTPFRMLSAWYMDVPILSSGHYSDISNRWKSDPTKFFKIIFVSPAPDTDTGTKAIDDSLSKTSHRLDVWKQKNSWENSSSVVQSKL